MRYLILIMTMMITVGLSAQRDGDRGKRGDKIEQQRIAYITTELDINLEEAQAFWPIYNEYHNAKNEIVQRRKPELKLDEMTEEEAAAILIKTMEVKRRLLDLEYEYMNKLEKILPAKKRLMLLRVEREFKKSVLRKYKKVWKRTDKEEEVKEKRKREHKEGIERN